MSWHMRPDDRREAHDTVQTREAYQRLLNLQDDKSDDHLLPFLLSVLSPDEVQSLQARFDQDNGDPRIPESERTNLGPLWPPAARRLLRFVIFNDPRRITEQLDAKYETVVDVDNVESASLLTEDPDIVVPLKVVYGSAFSAPKVPSTRLGMVNKHIWILIGAKPNRYSKSLPHGSHIIATDSVQLGYATVSDPFCTSPVPASSFLMRGVTHWRYGDRIPEYEAGEIISSLDEIVLLKHLLLDPDGFLDRKDLNFGRHIRDIVRQEIQEYVGGEYYLAENTPRDGFS